MLLGHASYGIIKPGYSKGYIRSLRTSIIFGIASWSLSSSKITEHSVRICAIDSNSISCLFLKISENVL